MRNRYKWTYMDFLCPEQSAKLQIVNDKKCLIVCPKSIKGTFVYRLEKESKLTSQRKEYRTKMKMLLDWGLFK